MNETLGKGSYGVVYRSQDYAIKVFNNKSHIIQEYAAGRYLDKCNNVVKVVDADFDKLELKMNLCDYSLRNWIDSNIYKPEYEKKLFIIIKDLLYGINEIHNLGLAHGDIKPGNCLITTNPKFTLLIADLGFVATPKYAKVERTAPVYRELNVSQTQKSDLFSCGILITELFGKIKINRQASYEEIKELISYKITDTTYRNILLSLTNEDPNKRYSIKEVIKILYNDEQYVEKNLSLVDFDLRDLDESSKKYIRRTIKQYAYKYDIKRPKIAYIALSSYINENNIHKSEYDIYIAATIFIFAAVFGKSKFKESNVDSLITNTKDLNKTLNILLNNKSFLTRMYYQ
jgi:serine/threonine-protein kinase